MRTVTTTSRGLRLLPALVLIIALAAGLFPAPTRSYAAAPTDLFFSEYIEGSSNNKALEIYNGTGAAVDLAAGQYVIQMYSNGNTTTSVVINLTGTVADGDTYVVAQSSADPIILAQADQTNGSGWYNGNDAVVLRKGGTIGTIVDVIGQIGFNPGTEWGTGDTSTADNTLRRIDSICAGDMNPDDAFDPATEWAGYPTNTFDGLGSHTAACGTVAVSPKINEFSASTAGTDVEYIELYGAASADYSDLSVLQIEGDFSGTLTGTVDSVTPMGSTDANGLYLANLAANTLENGTITLLLVRNFSSASGTDLDTNDDGALDSTPWDEIVDSVAVNDGGASDLTYGAPVLGVAYDGAAYAPGGASRIPDGADSESASDWVRNDFDLAGIAGFAGTPAVGEALNTPGAANEEITYVSPCSDAPAITKISAIQGDGLASPCTGQSVTIEGVVVGDFEGPAGLSGFFVQEEASDADSDPLTSEGVFVYNGSRDNVSVGDLVQVTGGVSEYNGLTEIGASAVSVLGSGNSIAPSALEMPFTSIDDLERYEGMLVSFPQALTISEYFNFDRYGEMVVGLPLDGYDRFFTPTNIVQPGAEASALAAAYALRRITLDDGSNAQNPASLRHPNGQPFSLDNRFRGGDTVSNLTGVLSYGFSLYRIEPTAPADYTSVNPREATPPAVGGTLKVAGQNTLNFFTSIDTGAFICGPDQNMECRGADDQNELDRQQAKLLAALKALNADIVGLNELENTAGVEPLQTIVDGLNAELGAGTYAYINTGTIGGDAIKVGLIYKPARVSPLGDYALLTSAVDPRFVDTKSRPTLAQTFEDRASGGRFTVAVNHLKSKGSACDDLGDPDTGDGQGNCNVTRTLAAQALVDWLDGNPTGEGDGDYLIIGDLNSYAMEDPISAIKAGPDGTPGTADDYVNLINAYQGAQAYSYVFDGQNGYLDHALASASLAAQVTGTADWHINADEPDVLDYDTSFKPDAVDAIYAPDQYRISDHDTVIIGLSLTAAAPMAVDDAAAAFYRSTTTIPVLDNDSAGESGQLTITAVGRARRGLVSTDGSTITYRHLGVLLPGQSTTDSFTYTVRDALGRKSKATVRVEITRLRLTGVCPTGDFRITNSGSYDLPYSLRMARSGQVITGTAAPGVSTISTGEQRGLALLSVAGEAHDLGVIIPPLLCR
ncbi:ExeM/NucH family extracellular endonuclease [Oscillochloris sp. ZM17-4]|uniref:ExeM/NucH family extracellular endonuclease n=1 Tax=Oscillochloris sp. ZM17-4 TaxID=2866714 RepID=UPI001C72B03B|nr:ExeM/NucH family extracellular endonuclease [Oscillochloris sp. ZM17-4]MBX0328304.1 ExeM/NucH family extracellular endonuclease [Oscillochloris sp. ZM17-4]